MNPLIKLPEGWSPSRDKALALEAEFGDVVDLPLLLRRFRNFYVEGQTSRNWDAKFENWVLTEVERVRQRTLNGTDDMGIPLTQRASSIVPGPAQPGDPNYYNPNEG